MRRRDFLRNGLAVGLTATLAGCSNNSDDGTETATPTGAVTGTPTSTESGTPEEETATEEETEEDPEVDRPANYRWDMSPWINTELRNELQQYVEGTTNRVLSSHPAFEYSTEQPEDDHPVDFVGLRMIRDSNFDIMAQEPNTGPMERIVASFVDSDLYTHSKNDGFLRDSENAPASFDTESWQNAETVEESLDYGHSLLVSIAYNEVELPYDEQSVIIREAYTRHHNFDVLAWSVPMRDGSFQAGMMYSPDDDKIRTFNNGGEAWSGSGESQSHAEIQNWRVIEDPNDEARGNPTNYQHPVLFHTDEWDRGGISFEDAKSSALGMVFGIGTERFNDYTEYDATGIVDDITATTAATEQLTRTILEYNSINEDDRADFERIRDLANFAVGKYIQNPNTRGVIDTVENGGEEYDEYFGGDFAFYEVDDEDGSNNDIIDAVRSDQAGEYDNFGQVYDELEAV